MDYEDDMPSAAAESTPAPTDATATLTAREVLSKVLFIFNRLGPAGPLALVAASTPAISGFIVLATAIPCGNWLQAHFGPGLLLYVLIYTVLGGLSLMPTYAYSGLGGFAFGFAYGFPAAMLAFTAASLIAYLIGRFAAGDRATALIREHPKSQAIYDALVGRSFGRSLLIVTLLRVTPSSPFAITNLTLSAMRVNVLACLIGTVAGIAPRTAAVVYMGAMFKEAFFSSGESRWLFVGGIAVTIVVLAIIGHLANQALARVTQQNAFGKNAGQ